MIPFSIVISGPIFSRFGRINQYDVLNSLKMIKSINNSNQIVVSTYENEVPDDLALYCDHIIINDDPGADVYRNNPWPIGTKKSRNQSNLTRMLKLTLAGLSVCTNDFVIKTRIELIPQNRLQFYNWLNKVQSEFEVSDKKSIGFFTETYTGINFSINGLLGVLPDVLQFGHKEVLLNTWEESYKFWINNFEVLTRKSINYPITPEQLLGLNYLKIYTGLEIDDKLFKLRRNYISLSLIKSVLNAENNLYVWSKYNLSGFSLSYLKGSSFIVIPVNMSLMGKTDVLKKILIVILKRIKHRYRRYFVGLRMNLLQNSFTNYVKLTFSNKP